MWVDVQSMVGLSAERGCTDRLDLMGTAVHRHGLIPPLSQQSPQMTMSGRRDSTVGGITSNINSLGQYHSRN